MKCSTASGSSPYLQTIVQILLAMCNNQWNETGNMRGFVVASLVDVQKLAVLPNDYTTRNTDVWWLNVL